MEKIYLNGKDAYTTYGVSFPPEAINNIMMPCSLKDRIKNESRLEHGTRYINSGLRVKERNVTVEMHLTTKNGEFNAKYIELLSIFEGGTIDIILGRDENVVYHFLYDSCSQFSVVGNVAKYVLKLIEPNPKNRV